MVTTKAAGAAFSWHFIETKGNSLISESLQMLLSQGTDPVSGYFRRSTADIVTRRRSKHYVCILERRMRVDLFLKSGLNATLRRGLTSQIPVLLECLLNSFTLALF